MLSFISTYALRILNSLLACGEFCSLLITFANRLDPDQNVGPDLDQKHLSLTADPGVASLIPARSHTFVEIDHEIISTAILLLSTESFKKGCC